MSKEEEREREREMEKEEGTKRMESDSAIYNARL